MKLEFNASLFWMVNLSKYLSFKLLKKFSSLLDHASWFNRSVNRYSTAHGDVPSLYVRIWPIKTAPALKELKYFWWPQTHNIDIQMNQKDVKFQDISDDFKLKKKV